jgi:membrane associated rhomboid family serine protease
VEKLYGKKLLALYFVSGVLGEIFAYIWSPDGAGSSLGIAGGIGGLFAFTFLCHQEVPRFVRIFSIGGIVGAIVLCVYRDIHGPPILIGALLAGLINISSPKPQGGADGKQSLGSDLIRESTPGS